MISPKFKVLLQTYCR